MTPEIATASESLSPSDLQRLREIFFLSSNIKVFANNTEQEKFWQRWCGQYLENYPQFFLLARMKGELVAYLCAHPDSYRALSEFQIPGQELFAAHFSKFPFHLHINAHPDARGSGMGGHLIEFFCECLALEGIPGVHVITGDGERNNRFYRRHGFAFEDAAQFKGHRLLFMGRNLLKN